MTELSNLVEHQKLLIENLEQDLLMVHNTVEKAETEGEASTDHGESYLAITRADLLDEADEKPLVPIEMKTTGADNLLPIVSSQRERFKLRVQQLEMQHTQQHEQLVTLKGEVERCRTDNVNLYGKIKFLQSYQSRESHQSIPLSTNDDTDDRYSSEYECRLDPFRRFGIQENQRKYAQLPVHDKATLGISRLIMGNSNFRIWFFFYLLFLHLFVFVVLYHIAYTESCKRDFATDCVDRFRHHMHQVHGQADPNS